MIRRSWGQAGRVRGDADRVGGRPERAEGDVEESTKVSWRVAQKPFGDICSHALRRRQQLAPEAEVIRRLATVVDEPEYLLFEGISHLPGDKVLISVHNHGPTGLHALCRLAPSKAQGFQDLCVSFCVPRPVVHC